MLRASDVASPKKNKTKQITTKTNLKQKLPSDRGRPVKCYNLPVKKAKWLLLRICFFFFLFCLSSPTIIQSPCFYKYWSTVNNSLFVETRTLNNGNELDIAHSIKSRCQFNLNTILRPTLRNTQRTDDRQYFAEMRFSCNKLYLHWRE